MLVDQKAHRLYLADNVSKGVDVFDVSKSPTTYIKTIDLQGTSLGNVSAWGLAVAKDVNELFVGCSVGPGMDFPGAVAIIDLNSDTVIKTLNTGGSARTDEMDYDPVHKQVWAANASDHFVTVMDA